MGSGHVMQSATAWLLPWLLPTFFESYADRNTGAWAPCFVRKRRRVGNGRRLSVFENNKQCYAICAYKSTYFLDDDNNNDDDDDDDDENNKL